MAQKLCISLLFKISDPNENSCSINLYHRYIDNLLNFIVNKKDIGHVLAQQIYDISILRAR